MCCAIECECACGKVCGLARADQRRVLTPHGVKRHPLGIGGVDGQCLRRVVVWRAASPMHSAAMLETCEIGANSTFYFFRNICRIMELIVVVSILFVSVSQKWSSRQDDFLLLFSTTTTSCYYYY